VPDTPGWSWGIQGEAVVFSAIDMVRRMAFIRPGEIYLTGFSLGGTLAWGLGIRYPDRFRGIAPLAARFEPEWIPENRADLQRLRVYIGHGEKDARLEGAKQALRAFLETGSPVRLRIYPDTGHSIPEPRLEELIRVLRFLRGENE
jgi:predicted esterase